MRSVEVFILQLELPQTSLPAVRGEADAADRFVKVEMMEDGSGDETDQKRCAICTTQT